MRRESRQAESALQTWSWRTKLWIYVDKFVDRSALAGLEHPKSAARREAHRASIKKGSAALPRYPFPFCDRRRTHCPPITSIEAADHERAGQGSRGDISLENLLPQTHDDLPSGCRNGTPNASVSRYVLHCSKIQLQTKLVDCALCNRPPPRQTFSPAISSIFRNSSSRTGATERRD